MGALTVSLTSDEAGAYFRYEYDIGARRVSSYVLYLRVMSTPYSLVELARGIKLSVGIQ